MTKLSLAGKKICVTGAGGFVGKYLVEALVAAGADPVASTTDVLDTEKLQAEFAGAFAVVHLAAVPIFYSNQHPAESHRVNVTGTVSVFEAAKAVGVDRVVYASSVVVYGNNQATPKIETMMPEPASFYALQKWEVERQAELYFKLTGLKTIGLRYANIFGPGQSFTPPYALVVPTFINDVGRGDRPKVMGDGRQTRDFIYVDDVVAANLAALSAAEGFGEVYNIASGQSVAIVDLINKIGSLFGKTVEIEHLPARSGDVKEMQIDTTKAKQVFGFEPKRSLDDGLAKTVEFYRSLEV